MPTTHTVRIQGMVYDPDPITIQAGDSIAWENRDSMEHTATFDFDARRVAAGATSDPLTFPQASGPSGFVYFCEIHPEMIGGVNVGPAKPTTHTVRIQGMVYDPDPITIKAGDSIAWENRDSMEHTATFDFDARRVAAGATSDPLTFPQASGPSSFVYFCEIHPEMLGGVNVEPAKACDERGPTPLATTAAAAEDAVQKSPRETQSVRNRGRLERECLG